MINLLQRVERASVSISGQVHSAINRGLLVLTGIAGDDTQKDLDRSLKKILNLRIFPDEAGKMNLSLQDIGGELLIVSQFTLYADVKKGNRPSFTEAAVPAVAVPLYEAFLAQATQALGYRVKSGVFGANMQIELINDGPVTLILDSRA